MNLITQQFLQQQAKRPLLLQRIKLLSEPHTQNDLPWAERKGH